VEFSVSILTIVFIGGISAALPLIFILNVAYWGIRTANTALMAILIHLCFMSVLMLLIVESWGGGHPAFLALFDMQLCHGPLLYFYAKALMEPNFRWRRGLLLHLLPAAAGAAIWLLQLPLTENDWLLGPCAADEGCNLYWRARFLHKASYAISMVTYAMLAFSLLGPYRRYIKKSHSDIEGQSLVWLQVFLFFFLFSGIYSVGVELGGVLWGQWANAQLSASIGNAAFVILTMLLVMYGIRQPSAVQEEKEASSTSQAGGVKDDDDKKIWQDLLTLMEGDKPYLENGLKITKLAQLMQVSVHDLSKTINVCAGQNFYDFINKYRIDEAVHLLGDTSKQYLSVTDIAYQSGFNSSSTFFGHFKKRLQLTPRQYRVQRAEEQSAFPAAEQ